LVIVLLAIHIFGVSLLLSLISLTFPYIYDNVVCSSLLVDQILIIYDIREYMKEAYFPPDITKKIRCIKILNDYNI